MKISLTPEEQKLIEHAQAAIVAYNKTRHERGGVDTLYSFVLSERGKIYDGACFESPLAHATICGERHAIANMAMNESYDARIKSIVVADPVPEVQKHSRTPCGTDRHLIWKFGSPQTTVLLLQYILTKKGWLFPKMEKFKIAELYPHPYEPAENIWDGWEPK